jgi:DNA polymerase III sliding clamp (beta) subunit (PCNA family)
MTQISLPAAAFAATLDAVRFAVGTDPTLPALAGVLIEADPTVVRLVATDRYRLALAGTPADVKGPPVRLVLPLSFVDELRDRLAGAEATGTLTLDVTADSLSAELGSDVVTGTPAGTEFPDYRRLVRSDGDGSAGVRLAVDAAALRDLLATEPSI